MKTTPSNVLLAAGAFAQLALAQPHLAPRDYVTELEYTTILKTVTNTGAASPSSVVSHANWRQHQHSHRSTTKTATTDAATAVSQSSVVPVASSASTLATSAAYTLSSYANTFSAASSSATSSSVVKATSAEAVVTLGSSAAYGGVSSSTLTAAAVSSYSATSTGSGTGAITTGNSFVGNGIKAGLSGFVGIANTDKSAFDQLAPYIGWYSDYTAVTPDVGNVVGVPMLWGNGQTCTNLPEIAERVVQFKNMTTAPKMMFGFYEPDCDCPMSSDMSDPTVGASAWNEFLAPLATNHGTKLGSPSMCKQKDEDWLKPFKAAGLNADWDVTSIHINVQNLTRAMEDVETYIYRYGKPIWISEFACVDDTNGNFVACTEQSDIDNFLETVIPYFQWHPKIVAYGASNGEGLGSVWPLTSNGGLSKTGQKYLEVLQKLPETMETFDSSTLPSLPASFSSYYLTGY